jgi:uncharacterized YccA/Bax inhibitor family protein
MANPVLTADRFHIPPETEVQTSAAAAGAIPPPPPAAATAPDEKRMTVGGTITATGVLFALILASGAFGWSRVVQTSVWMIGNQVVPEGTPNAVLENTTSIPGWLFISALVGFGLAMVAIFKPRTAPFLAPLYALCYGVALGAISAVYNQSYDGIVVQAVLATFSIFLVMLFLYVTRIIKVTKRFVMVVVAATLGIMVMYLITWVATLFGADIAFWNQPSALGIGITVVILIVAALNLALDFAFIERASAAGAPRYMEWTGALGVTVTMVWIYLEVLRLLAMLRR